ncbi:hypothetical protein OAJ56_01450 [Flavobacteriales bacterium]|nr:hypothetical protein [Flavobacteriales bacterium]
MKKIINIIFLLIISVNSYSQDNLFSQSDLDMLFMNPAYAGYHGMDGKATNRILIHDREQWLKINGRPFNTSYAEASFNIGSSRKSLLGSRSTFAIGGYLMSDWQDIIFQTDEIGISLSGISQVNKYFIHQLGLGFSLKHGKINNDGLIFGDQLNYYNNNVAALDPQNLPLTTSYTSYPNPGAGYIAGFRINRRIQRWTTIGFSGMNLFRNANKKSFNNTEYNVNPPRYYTFINHNEPIKLETTISSIKSVNIFARHMRQIERLDRIEAGITLEFKTDNWEIIPGLVYRRSDAFDNRYMQESLIGIIRYKFRFKNLKQNNWKMSINYSYDFNRSELTHISSGSTHEMGIALHLFTRNKSICAGVCPAE